MILLAADTSTATGSVALRDREGKVLRKELERGKPHSETLLPTINQILADSGLLRENVRAIAVGTGPGAFTGLRVGLATFKAWAAAARLPLIPVVSLDAAALPHLEKGSAVAVLADARKGEVYAAYYPSLDSSSLPLRQGDIALISHEDVPGWLSSLNDPDVRLAGTGLPPLAEKGLFPVEFDSGPNLGAPDALSVLSIAEILLALGRTVDPAGLVPAYVRPPDASKPQPGSVIT